MQVEGLFGLSYDPYKSKTSFYWEMVIQNHIKEVKSTRRLDLGQTGLVGFLKTMDSGGPDRPSAPLWGWRHRRVASALGLRGRTEPVRTETTHVDM